MQVHKVVNQFEPSPLSHSTVPHSAHNLYFVIDVRSFTLVRLRPERCISTHATEIRRPGACHAVQIERPHKSGPRRTSKSQRRNLGLLPRDWTWVQSTRPTTLSIHANGSDRFCALEDQSSKDRPDRATCLMTRSIGSHHYKKFSGHLNEFQPGDDHSGSGTLKMKHGSSPVMVLSSSENAYWVLASVICARQGIGKRGMQFK